MKTAKMIVDRDYTLAHTDEKLFSSFVSRSLPIIQHTLLVQPFFDFLRQFG